MVDLSPASWPTNEVRGRLDRGQRLEGYNPASGHGAHGVVVGSTGPFAQYIGRKTLEAGGNAIDAAVATALGQVTLALGSWVSFAGIFTLVYYEASSGSVSAMVAPFKTFAGETDPGSIPKAPTPSGRTALVPGFIAGVHAAQERFGSFSWEDVLVPAIWLAEEGFPLDGFLARTLRQRTPVLARTPEARQVFMPTGDVPGAGEMFRQAQLAETLRHLAKEGADYMYRGPWAERFVEVVRREGGRADIDDLAGYAPIWGEPTRGTFAGHQIYGCNWPCWGGAALIEALHMVEAAGAGDPLHDADALRWFVDIARQTQMHSTLPVDMRTDPAFAGRTVETMRAAGGAVSVGELFKTTHSDFVVSADAHGNVAAACHSINTVFWGSSGLFVDGISIPDAAAFQQALLATVPAGDYLPTPPNPSIAMRDGKVTLASSSIGSGLHEVTVQCVAAALRGVPVAEAAERPVFHGAGYLTGDSIVSGIEEEASGIDALAADSMVSRVDRLMAEELAAGTAPEDLMVRMFVRSGQVVEDRFPPEVLDAAESEAVQFVRLPAEHHSVPRGHWGAVQPATDGGWDAGRTPFAGGAVEAL